MTNTSPAVPHQDDDVLPPKKDLNSILDLIALALSELPGADGFTLLRAHAVMDKQFSKGCTRGREEGFRNGYDRGYQEGLQDGRSEALDKAAREEAESATIKAAARARLP